MIFASTDSLYRNLSFSGFIFQYPAIWNRYVLYPVHLAATHNVNVLEWAMLPYMLSHFICALLWYLFCIH